MTLRQIWQRIQIRDDDRTITLMGDDLMRLCLSITNVRSAVIAKLGWTRRSQLNLHAMLMAVAINEMSHGRVIGPAMVPVTLAYDDWVQLARLCADLEGDGSTWSVRLSREIRVALGDTGLTAQPTDAMVNQIAISR